MPHTIPESPRFASSAEESVWRLLNEQLLDTDLLVANQRVTDHDKDHEIDLVVAIEGAGIACLEVKGGEVWHDGESWHQRISRDRSKTIDPVRQAREGKYALSERAVMRPRSASPRPT